MTHRAVIELTITLRSPFIMRGLVAGPLGLDAATLRDEAGRPLIPADQVKGLLRAACRTLVQATGGSLIGTDDIDQLFGRPSGPPDPDSGEVNRPERGALIFGDLTGPSPAPDSPRQQMTRVSIDPITGAAKTGHLQVIELAAPLGAEVTFTGTVIARETPLGSAFAHLAEVLDKAARLIPAVGGLKSAGFGEVTAARAVLAKAAPTPLAPARAAADGDRMVQHYRVTFDRRLLVDARRLADNVWEGQSVVPGAVFKGAIAERLARAGESPQDDTALAALRISHAFPENDRGEVSGLALPLSLIAVNDKDGDKDVRVFADALCGGTPESAPMLNGRPPAFQPDWKDEDFGGAAKAVGYPEAAFPAKLARGHTEIGADYVAADGRLYVDVGVSPFLNATDVKRRWRMEVRRGEADPASFARVLALLDEGLDGIGATGASASFERFAPAPRRPLAPVAGGGSRQWAVLLATPAMMLNVDPAADNPVDLAEHYRRYWSERLPGARLVNFFARQRLAGGYIAVRRRMRGPDKYTPFLLTEPGSVFLFEGDIEAELTGLVNHGLPDLVPDWRVCPYVRGNGYGEIRVNAIDHQALAKGVKHV